MSDIKRVAIVTGASQGLGEGIVKGSRARGYGVVATSRSIQPSTDPDLVTVAGDIGDPGTGRRLVAAALEKFGRIDTLVNNAGIFIGKAFTDYTEEEYRLKLRTNLDGFFFTTQQVIPVMLEQGGSHVVQITAPAVQHRLHDPPTGSDRVGPLERRGVSHHAIVSQGFVTDVRPMRQQRDWQREHGDHRGPKPPWGRLRSRRL